MFVLPTRSARSVRRPLGLALAAVLTAAALAGCSSDPETVASDPIETTTSPTPSEVDEPSEPTTTEPPQEASQVAAPLYFVGETPMGLRLFREFRKVQDDNPLEEAAALLTAGDVLDPDYRTLFPSGSFASVAYSDGGFVAELADAGWQDRPDGMSRDDATLALQQLVYTLQGVQQERAPVVVTLDGEPTTLFGLDTAGGVTNAPDIEVLALVNVTSPEEGAIVTDTFTASGLASSFEATVPWEVRQGETVVQEGFATAEGWMDKLYPWETEVDVSGLAPGDYTFVARTDDPSGGEGFGPTEDSKTFTVG